MKQEINKLIGYATITVQGEQIPLKFGWWALRDFCNHFNIKPGEIMSKLFDYVKNDKDEEIPVVKDILSFLPVLLWAGANYVNVFNGGPGYRIIDAANWIDEMGGPSSDQLNQVYAAFFQSLTNGAEPAVSKPDDPKKKETI